MENKFLAIFTSLLLLVTTIYIVDTTTSIETIPVDDKTWISFYGSNPGEEPILNVIESSATKTIIDVTLPGFWVTEVAIEKNIYQEISIPEHSTTMEIGEPAIPIIRSLITIPDNCIIEPTYTINDQIKLENYRITVFEEPTFDNQEIQTRTKPKPLYIPKPDFVVQTIEPGIWKDIKVVTVEIAPISYEYSKQTLTVTPKMTVELHYTSTNGENPEYTDKSISPLYDNMYQNHVINYNLIGLNVQPLNNPGTKYLIISHPDFISDIQPLADWHQQEGIETELISLSTTSYEDVKDEIVSRYNEGDLEYVLLIGDTTYMPIGNWEGFYSDYYYACITGAPDYYADIAVGRLSVTESDDLTNQVNKILKYEKNPPKDSWLKEIILVAHKEQAPGKYVGCKEEIRTEIIPQPPFEVEKYYGNEETGTNDNVADAIDEGRNIVNYRGHGSNTAWTGWSYTSEYWEISDVEALTNGDKTPVVFNIACQNHYLLDDCLGEAFMSKYPGGAVASLGATDPSYTIPNHDYDKELFRQFTLYGEYRIGWMSNAAATLIVDGHGSMGIDNAQMYLWLGDPATEVWTGIPDNVSVDYPPTIPYGQSIVEIIVENESTPLENALVCLMQPDGIYASGYTDSNGTVELNVDVQNPDEATLTVSAHDHYPYITQVQIGDSLPPLPPIINGTIAGKPDKEYEFTATTTDPEEDQILYLFDWGDGTTSDWLGPYNSGETITISHAWTEVNNYNIKVRAKDVNESTGYWSDPFTIQIRLPVLDIGIIKGGLFRITAEIKNTGIVEAEEINWTISLDGGFIFMGQETSGAINTMLKDEVENISSKLILGFGDTRVFVTVNIPEGSIVRDQGASIIFFFIIVNPGG